MFKKLALAGAGVAAGGILAQASPAAAADNDNIVIGKENNAANSPTALIRARNFAGNEVLLIDDNSGFIDDDSAFPGAVAGWSGNRVGVYGFTEQGPQAIVAWGRLANSAGLFARGGRANIELFAEGDPPRSESSPTPRANSSKIRTGISGCAWWRAHRGRGAR
jgi:hypothetical protein